jgi:(hydroxyamino)benzene mutase
MTIQSGGKQTLIHGLAMILAGLVWGFGVPQTPYPRLAVGAHVQFETNGMLFVLLGLLLLALPHGVGRKSVWVIVLSAWLTWLMALSEVANAWWGANQLLPIAAGQAGAHGGAPWQEAFVKLSHIPAALGLILSLILLIRGFLKQPQHSS